ncbi:MAG TPA: hypothetical protein VEC95_05735 [Terriglobales bacterium]|nr:hypothetical protein [Terriglobales bacterium]
MRRLVLLGAGGLLLLIMGTAWLGCGGGGAVSSVANITLNPTALSLNRGATATLAASATDAFNTAVSVPALEFHSSNPSVITVSTAGVVCAGQWDSSFDRCYTCSNPDLVTSQCPANSSVNLPLGTASITATASVNNVILTSSTVVVTDHEPIDSVQVVPAATTPVCAAPPSNVCVSQNGTAPFTLQAFSNDPAACQRITGSTTTPCQVPNDTVGIVSWSLSPGQVATADATLKTATNPVCLTAVAPGQGTVVGTVGLGGSMVSGSAPYATCAVASVHVHQQNATPTPPDTATSFTSPIGGTVPLVADVTDTLGNSLTNTVSLTWQTSQPALASVSPSTAQGATVQALAPGVANITAACLPPSCNVNFTPPQPVYSDNSVTANITGTTDSTVFVTTATPPATSSLASQLVPIDTQTNAPVTALVLPVNSVVNSMVIAPVGNSIFLGTACTAGTTTGPNGTACSGLLQFSPVTNVVGSPVPSITGAVLTTDGNRVVVSDPSINQLLILTGAGTSVEAVPPINISNLITPSGATESGNTVTLTTTNAHGLSVGQSVVVAGVAVAGYNGVYSVLTTPSPTTLTYTDPNSGLAPSGGGYLTGGVSAAISPDGSKIYIVTGQGTQQKPGGKLYVYHTGLPLLSQDLSGNGMGSVDPTSTQAVTFFPTGLMAYLANSGAHADDLAALTPPACNDAIAISIPVGNAPTHVAALPSATLFPFGSVIPAMVGANSPNVDEVDVDATSAAACPLAITNSFTPYSFAGVNSFTPVQLLVTPNSQIASILTSDQGVLVYNVGTKQTSVVTLLGGPPPPQPLSGGVTPDSASLYVGATDGNVHRIDLTKTPPTDTQTIAVSLCPSVAAGCNPDFLVVRPVAVVAALTKLVVAPVNPTISVGQTEQFTATGTFSDNTTRDMTDFVTWASSMQSVALIGPNLTAVPPLTTPGLARAIGAGTTVITATTAGVVGSTTMVVQ